MRISIVEDDPVYARFLKYIVEMNPEDQAVVYSTGKELLENLSRETEVVTVDYSLPDMSCEDLLKKIRRTNKQVQVVAISAQEDISTAVKLLKNGVYDYIEKTDETKDLLLNTIKHLKENKSLKTELETLRAEVKSKYDFGSIIKGNSPQIQKIFGFMEKASKTNITVSVSGETGTGKELVAKAIHYNSRYRKKPLVSVNIAAIPKELVESELFGHEKGAFTGAESRRIGKFEEANGGTLFLDEIAEVPLNVQTKILRALQEREIERVGGNKKVKLDLRLIVATHKNLAEEVKRGEFREDLYYRILGLPIELPPLRDRGGDILVLAQYFMEDFCKDNHLDKISFSKDAIDELLNYDWPGNVRELKAVIELSAVMAEGRNEVSKRDIILKSARNSPEFLLKEMALQDYINKIVEHYLEKYDNDVLEVARKLDVGKSTIYRMLKEGKVSKN